MLAKCSEQSGAKHVPNNRAQAAGGIWLGMWQFLFLLGTYSPLVGAFSGQGPGLLSLRACPAMPGQLGHGVRWTSYVGHVATYPVAALDVTVRNQCCLWVFWADFDNFGTDFGQCWPNVWSMLAKSRFVTLDAQNVTLKNRNRHVAGGPWFGWSSLGG